jgi:hypothetical protein
MSDTPTVAALLCEQEAASFPVVIEVQNNTPMTLCRTGARIGVAPYSNAQVSFATQAELAIFVKKVGAQARLHGRELDEIYPMTVLQATPLPQDAPAAAEAAPAAKRPKKGVGQ